ncbi:MAG: ZIP family metal transporter [bacterium]|nr:ZIP family metal transporter [bacterium]
MNYLIAFASGVFLIVAYDLIFEALEFAPNKLLVAGSVIGGFLLFFCLEKLYPEAHCHHDDAVCQSDKSRKGARRILIGDSFHNIGDGILLAPVFIANIWLGLVAAFGIFVHEFVQEISEFFVLKNAGYSNKKALKLNFLVSGTILIGALGGFYLSSFELLVAPLIGLAAGAFIYILLVDLIPQSVKHSHRERKYLHFLVWTLAGVLLILAVNAVSAAQFEKLGLDASGHGNEEEYPSTSSGSDDDEEEYHNE